MRRIAFVICLLRLSTSVDAASLRSGTWVLRNDAPGLRLTMIVEDVGAGRRLTYKVVSPDAQGDTISSIATPLDGKVLKVEDDNAISSPNGMAGKQVQYWDKQ